MMQRKWVRVRVRQRTKGRRKNKNGEIEDFWVPQGAVGVMDPGSKTALGELVAFVLLDGELPDPAQLTDDEWDKVWWGHNLRVLGQHLEPT